jgi:hypothetical protein
LIIRIGHLWVPVGVGDEYFKDVERFELYAAAAVAQSVHDDLRTTVREGNASLRQATRATAIL